MEYIVKELLHPEEDDEARYVYSELDSERKETRRVEFYPGGVCFSYGGDMGHDEVLDPTPFPAELRTPRRVRGAEHFPADVLRGLGTGTGAAGRIYGDVFLRKRAFLPYQAVCGYKSNPGGAFALPGLLDCFLKSELDLLL